jgi:hypothetical protein
MVLVKSRQCGEEATASLFRFQESALLSDGRQPGTRGNEGPEVHRNFFHSMESQHFASRNPPYRIEEYGGSEAKIGDTCENDVHIPNAEKGPDFIASMVLTCP